MLKKISYIQYLDDNQSLHSYSDSFEHIVEHRRLLHAYFDTAFTLKKCDDDEKKIILSQVIKEFENMHAHIRSRVQVSIQQNIELRLENIIHTFGLTSFEVFILLIALNLECSPKNEFIYSELHEQSIYCLPTIGMAWELFRIIHHVEEEEIAKIINESCNLSKYLLIPIHQEYRKEAFLSKSICLRKGVVCYLLGLDEFNNSLNSYSNIYNYDSSLSQMLVHKKSFDKLKNLFEMIDSKRKMEKAYVIHIYGKNGNGKHLQLKHLAKQLHFHIIFIDLLRLMKEDKSETEERLYNVFLEGILKNSVICFEIINENAYKACMNEQLFQYEQVIQLAKKELPYFFIISEEKDVISDRRGIQYINFKIPDLLFTEKIHLWKTFAREYTLEEGINLELLANRYTFSIQGIQNIFNTAYLISKSEKHECITPEDMKHSVKQWQSDTLGNEAILINAEFIWNDFIIDEKSKRQMHLACNQVKYKNVVFDEWGFRSKLPYGKGVSVLFYGPPGTGKTMAAQVMASDLGIDLYRIDLSQLVSKYIGETEKNISNLFKKASNSNVLLFFDEADAIFAKRSEISDSNDRNANTMTSHLLQKLEEYDGMTILATNYMNNIDDAFKRRMKHMIQFTFPSPEERLQLWTSMLPKETKCEEELDFEFFSKKFELSGSSIKEILVNSAFMAASERCGVKNVHIIEGIKMNYAKYKKMLTEKDFEYLA